jgi:hypothetical protein
MSASAWTPVDETAEDTSAWIPVNEAPSAGLSVPAPPPNPILDPLRDAQAATAGLPGGSPNIQPATDTMAKVAGAGIGLAAGGVYGPVLLPAVKAGVKALPYVAASEAINYAKRNLPGEKYIPSGAEMNPKRVSNQTFPTNCRTLLVAKVRRVIS